MPGNNRGRRGTHAVNRGMAIGRSHTPIRARPVEEVILVVAEAITESQVTTILHGTSQDHRHTIKQLKDRIQDLVKQIKDKNKEISGMERCLRALKEENGLLKKANGLLKEENGLLKEQNRLLKEENGRREAHLVKIKANIRIGLARAEELGYCGGWNEDTGKIDWFIIPHYENLQKVTEVFNSLKKDMVARLAWLATAEERGYYEKWDGKLVWMTIQPYENLTQIAEAIDMFTINTKI